ncbi:hypothetical protein QY95_00558 [Bacillus thermotolerans]|uniref:Uncharacterized protein n=1 Tax=Bacillus thermotolerans TaxID=1221996 RepID=A0A0F5I8A5_BACTR|nr:hypothetical protein QY95_00558 [Bacillus thermotolerans]
MIGKPDPYTRVLTFISGVALVSALAYIFVIGQVKRIELSE